MAAPLSFAAMAERKNTEEQPLRVVQLDTHVVLKIVKHCKEGFPTLVTGQLLGLDVGQTLEVTDCFPFPVSVPAQAPLAKICRASVTLMLLITCMQMFPMPCCGGLQVFHQKIELRLQVLYLLQSRNDEEDGEGDGASYQLDMMRCLREVNVDNNTVGW